MPLSSPPCAPEELAGVESQTHPFERGLATGFYEQMGYDVDPRPLPQL